MEDIFRRIEFRQFSFEHDPEFLVDMYRCRDVLEGGWFDNEEFCRMHNKIVCRAKGTSWVGILCRAVIGYADLLELTPGCGIVQKWALHPNFRHPLVTNCLVNGLREQGKRRGWTSLVFYAESEEALIDLEATGLKRDRPYYQINTSDLNPSPDAVEVLLPADLQTLLSYHLIPFLGSPISPDFFISKAFLAAEYGVFHHKKPLVYRIISSECEYLACHDGREWCVFRYSKNPSDGEQIPIVLAALERIFPGRITLSKAAIQKVGLQVSGLQATWDLFLG